MITIIIPTYNDNKHLIQAINSVVDQNWSGYRIIVVDDCGSDSAKPIVDAYCANHQIQYVRTETNCGPGGARNLGLEQIKVYDDNDYVLFLDSDDVLLPYSLMTLSLAIAKNSSDLLYGRIVEQVGDEKLNIYTQLDYIWVHSKLYKLKTIKDNNIKFPQLKTNEDLAFNLIFASYTNDSTSIDSEITYHRYNYDSLTHGNTKTYYRCCSTDGIAAVYYAYKHSANTNSHLIEFILNCYRFYQNAACYRYDITEDIYTKIREMLLDKEVRKAIITNSMSQQKFNQSTLYEDKLVYYSQSFAAWVMNFVTKEELLNGISNS